MPDIGDPEKVINSEVVNLYLGADEGGDLLATMYNLVNTKQTPQSRQVAKNSIAVDFDGVTLQEVRFNALVSSTIIQKLNSWFIRSAATGQKPYNVFTVHAFGIDGNVGFSETINAKLTDFSYTAGEQGGFVVLATLRAKAY